MNKKKNKTELTELSRKFVEKNGNNETDTFKKWKWDAIINAIETGKIDEAYLKDRNYI